MKTTKMILLALAMAAGMSACKAMEETSELKMEENNEKETLVEEKSFYAIVEKMLTEKATSQQLEEAYKNFIRKLKEQLPHNKEGACQGIAELHLLAMSEQVTLEITGNYHLILKQIFLNASDLSLEWLLVLLELEATETSPDVETDNAIIETQQQILIEASDADPELLAAFYALCDDESSDFSLNSHLLYKTYWQFCFCCRYNDWERDKQHPFSPLS